MYASEMQICCYTSVKYTTGIKFHVYHQQPVDREGIIAMGV